MFRKSNEKLLSEVKQNKNNDYQGRSTFYTENNRELLSVSRDF